MPVRPSQVTAGPRRWPAAPLLIAAALFTAACVQGQRATDTGDPGFPFGPDGDRRAADRLRPGHQADLRSRLRSCHGGRETRAAATRCDTYAATVDGQRPGDASSKVVVDCSPGGSMYRYFAGDAVTERDDGVPVDGLLQRAGEPLGPRDDPIDALHHAAAAVVFSLVAAVNWAQQTTS